MKTLFQRCLIIVSDRLSMYMCSNLANSVDRDHVFFFSYMQPQQKGGVLNMWSDADALAKVNCKSRLAGIIAVPR